jgi:hypothetical protein
MAAIARSLRTRETLKADAEAHVEQMACDEIAPRVTARAVDRQIARIVRAARARPEVHVGDLALAVRHRADRRTILRLRIARRFDR